MLQNSRIADVGVRVLEASYGAADRLGVGEPVGALTGRGVLRAPYVKTQYGVGISQGYTLRNPPISRDRPRSAHSGWDRWEQWLRTDSTQRPPPIFLETALTAADRPAAFTREQVGLFLVPRYGGTLPCPEESGQVWVRTRDPQSGHRYEGEPRGHVRRSGFLRGVARPSSVEKCRGPHERVAKHHPDEIEQD